MAHEENRLVALIENGGWNCGFEIWLPLEHIVEAGEPDAVSSSLKRHGGIAQNGNATVSEGAGDLIWVHEDIVIAEYGESLGAGEAMENLRARLGLARSVAFTEDSVGDEIACEQDHIGVEGVDGVDRMMQEELFSEFAEMDITELGESQPLKCGGQVFELDVDVGDLEPVAGHFA